MTTARSQRYVDDRRLHSARGSTLGPPGIADIHPVRHVRTRPARRWSFGGTGAGGRWASRVVAVSTAGAVSRGASAAPPVVSPRHWKRRSMAGRRMGTKRPETTRRAVLCTDRRWSYACWLFGLGKRLRLFPLRVRVGWLMVLLAVNTWRGSMVMIRKREREGEEESAEAVEIILRIASSLVFSGPKGTRSVAPRKSARLMKMFPCPRHKHVPFPRWRCFARLVPRIRFPRPREEKKTGLTGSSSSGPCHTAACPRLCWLPARARQGWAVHQPSSSSGDVGGGATTTCLQGWRAVWACVCGR